MHQPRRCNGAQQTTPYDGAHLRPSEHRCGVARARYLRYQNDILASHERENQWTPKEEENGLSPNDKGQTHSLREEDSEQKMVKDLCADDYWNRVWIVQEIVQARQIKVCFGKRAMDWPHFIHLVTTKYD